MQFERQAWEAGCRRLAGVDEAGRGPLAGPVVAAAVVFDRAFVEAEIHGRIAGLTDSKQLSAAQRERFFQILTGSPAVAFAVAMCDAALIDEINILKATHRAMREALLKLVPLPDQALIDGLPVPGLPCPATAIVGGDGRSISIAAASVIAKVIRDRMMVEYDRQYPQYGFNRHKGYGTRAHTEALLQYGPCPIHRRSFRPVSDTVRIRKWIGDNPRQPGDGAQ